MDAPIGSEEDFSLYDVMSQKDSPRPDKNLMAESLNIEIERALETLPEKESQVIKLSYGIGEKHPMTLEEIGQIFDLTRERIRQIREKGIRKLRKSGKNRILMTYLG